jgi:tetratricopeptide (TPR) repeat protein
MSTTTDQRPGIGLLLLVLALTCAAFAQGLSGELVYDDLYTVGQNPAITSFANLREMFARPMWDFTGPQNTAAVGYWRPLANVVLAIGWLAGAKDPLAYHVLSLAVHLAATAVAFTLAHRLARSRTVAFFAALLFGVHPLHVESVSWISAINDPLFGLFALLAINAWVSWRERGSTGLPWLAGTWFLLSLLSKELGVAVVPIVVAYDFAAGHSPRPVRQFVPLLGALSVVYVARVAVFGEIGAGFGRTTTDYGVSFGRLIALRVEILGGLLASCVWPLDLRVFPVFVPAFQWPAFLRATAAIAGWTLAAITARKRMSPAATFAALFSPAALLPMLVRVESLGLFPASGRYAYLAIFGAMLCVSIALVRFLPRAVALSLLAAIAIAFGWKTNDRTLVWKDDVTLLSTAVEESPQSPYAHGVLGDALLQRYNRSKNVEDLLSSHEEFQKSLDLAEKAQLGDETIFAASADFVRANMGLGWTLMFEAEHDPYHDYETPATLFKMVTTRYPMTVEAWTGRGVAELFQGDLDEAEAALKHALELDPRHAQAHRYLGEVRAKRGDFDGARRAFEDALSARPEQPEYMLLLATELARAGDDARAEELYGRAARIDPKNPLPRVKLGVLRAKHGDFDGALAEIDRALELAPNDGEAWLEKGRVFLARGQKASALNAFQRSSVTLTESFDAHYNAGALLLEKGETSAAIPFLARAYQTRPDSPAGRALRDALQQIPIQSADVYLDLAASDAGRNDFDAALAWVAKAQALRPDDGEAHLLKGRLLRAKGEKEGALAEFERAAKALPEHAIAQQEYAAALLDAGNRQGAIDYLKRALEIAKRTQGVNPDAQAAIEALRSKIAELESGSR